MRYNFENIQDLRRFNLRIIGGSQIYFKPISKKTVDEQGQIW